VLADGVRNARTHAGNSVYRKHAYCTLFSPSLLIIIVIINIIIGMHTGRTLT